MHGDHQAMWIDPEYPNHIIDGNDGGLNFSYDRGKTWVDIKMPITQFYTVALDMDEPFNVYGSIQDGMSWYGSVASIPGITEPWRRFPGGERSHIAFDYSDYNTIYTSAGLSRTDRKTWQTKNIRPDSLPDLPPLRRNWYPPFILSPHNPQIIYYGTQMLLMSLDRGDHWHSISPDLTTNTTNKPGTRYSVHGTISTISESPFRFGLIYVGTADGNVQVTRNGGLSWNKIMRDLPKDRWISRIIASRYDEATVYVTLNGLRNDDFTAYIFKSTDYGTTWEDIKNNLPCGPINVLREDPKKKDILYIGTDLGIYVSLNQGRKWHSLGSNLPTAYVHDIAVHSRDDMLVIGTHGRSVYVTDVHPMQEYSQQVRRKDIHLFSMNPVYKVPQRGGEQEAPIYFHLLEDRPVRIEILNEQGKLIKSLAFEGQEGINAMFWDLSQETQGFRTRSAPPGKYTVSLVAGEAKASGTLVIKAI
jgi:hypothetical protein